jgi:UDP-2,3-diacylglucosamine hydrolase
MVPRSHDRPPPVGLVAGHGRFPLAFARKARDLGVPVLCAGISEEADPVLAKICDGFFWTGIAQMGRVMSRFRRAGVQRAVMAGKIRKERWLYRPWKWLTLMPDLRAIRWWFFRNRTDNKDDSLLLSVINEFAREGITVDSALSLCPELLVAHGVLTRRAPSAAELRDVAFGWDLARKMGELDVGQSVAVKERAVLAVEAVEGTDQAILRAGSLCQAGGFVVVKVAKPQQDMRFDVPTIGTSTVETLKKAGGRVLAIEAGKTIVLDQQETIALADRYGLVIVSLTNPQAAAA